MGPLRVDIQPEADTFDGLVCLKLDDEEWPNELVPVLANRSLKLGIFLICDDEGDVVVVLVAFCCCLVAEVDNWVENMVADGNCFPTCCEDDETESDDDSVV